MVEKIQSWIEENEESPGQRSSRQMMLAKKLRNRDLKVRIRSLTEQRDKALSMLVESNREIVNLTLENERLKSRLPSINVTRLK